MRHRTRSRSREGAIRSFACVAIAGAMLLTSGCTVIAGQQARTAAETRLAQTITETQGAVWDHRDALAADVDGAVDAMLAGGVSPITDARRVAAGTAIEVGSGEAALLGTDASPRNAVLTFTVVDAGKAGDYLTSTTRTEGLCFALRPPVDEAVIITEDAACPSSRGLPVADNSNDGQTVDLVPLARLDVRTTVSASDFRPPPCQCYSGSSCECPGG
ncbi:hypothetical protein [Leucobacter musarum]|uniref:hypothetical protein n=1 Tax=Leucobacter musarum TaxID=1930747 RepID=UPI000AA6D0CF|nr:hypothetical protein [Leucobacter musarum]